MRPSRLYFIAGILVLVLFGQSYSVLGQTIPLANHVVLNEVEVDPRGDDSRSILQWVELYNPTSSPVNVGGWTIGATTGLKNIYTLSTGTTIPSQSFLVYTYGPLWFPHAGSVVQLKSADGIIVDQTPPLTDQQDDSNTWQRIYDGYDTDSQSDWVFKIGTPGTTNGKVPTITTTNQFSMSVSTDKQGYTFGDVVNINGQVSQILTMPGTSQTPQTVNLVLSGTNGFHKTFTLYPGSDLKFSTSVKLDQVLGFGEGMYTISASYGDTQTSTSFQLTSEAFIPPPQVAPTAISVMTDKSNYTIMEPIILQGNVSNVIPLTPIKYKVYDPVTLIYEGTLFPDTKGHFTSSNPYQRSVATSGLLINSVNPTFGAYRVTVTYADASASTTFTLVPRDLQAAAISISTDKNVYSPGETVTISGKTNLSGLQNVGLSPSLQIIQTTPTGSSGTQTSGNRGIVPNAANIRTFVNIGSDNTFTYQFPISGGSTGLGNYRVVVTIPTGQAQASFVVVENPLTYQPTMSSAPFSIVTDKDSYALGDTFIISGHIANPVTGQNSNAGLNVRISVLNSTGSPLYSYGSFINNAFVPTSTTLSYSAYPDSNGQFQVQQTIAVGVFHPGNYTLKAIYSNFAASTSFTVYNPLATASQSPLVASTDKKVYGIGETVQLNGQTSGLTGLTSYTVSVLKPDGNEMSFPLQVNNGKFSWSWVVPSTAAIGSSGITSSRSTTPVSNSTANVYGIYRVTIHSGYYGNLDLFFQVSQNPQPNQEIEPITVQTDKTDYISTDVARISGQVIPVQNSAAKEQNTMAQITIFSDTGQQAYRITASVTLGGQFHISVPFHPGVWKTGNYRLYVQYLTTHAQINFKVTDPYTTSSGKLEVFMTTDTDKYLPGQTVLITGRTSYIISIDNVDISVGLANDTIIREGEVASKKGNTLPKYTAPFDQTGSFNYDYKIPNNAPLGNYTIVANVPFGTYNAYFQVVNQLPIANVTSGENETQTGTSNGTQVPPPQTIIPSSIGPNQEHATSNTLVKKIGKISDSFISITSTQIFADNKTYSPREIDGLLRINPGNENDVNIKVSAQDGTCIIGSDSGCKVTKSTMQSGTLYQIIKFNDTNFLVGYSGSGGRIQQFSIIPANANDVISDGQWNVEIIKKNQITRFYYQVSYVSK